MNKEEAAEALKSTLFKQCLLKEGVLKDIEDLIQERNHLVLTFEHKVELCLFYEAFMLVLYDQPSDFDYQYYLSLCKK